jgi:hypothetical protein
VPLEGADAEGHKFPRPMVPQTPHRTRLFKCVQP